MKEIIRHFRGFRTHVALCQRLCERALKRPALTQGVSVCPSVLTNEHGNPHILLPKDRIKYIFGSLLYRARVGVTYRHRKRFGGILPEFCLRFIAFSSFGRFW